MNGLREFNNVAELRQHYRETLQRLHAPPPAPKGEIAVAPKELVRKWWRPRVEPIFTKREIELFAILRRGPKRAPKPDARPAQIQAVVCDFYDVSLNDLLSDRKSRRIIRPRQVAMYLCRVLTGLSSPAIGRRFGDRDHTTILNAVERVEGLILRNPALASEIEEIKAVLTGDA